MIKAMGAEGEMAVEEKFAPQVDLPLDAGIRRYVLALRSGGVETYESCDGSPGHAFPEPTIRFSGNNAEGLRALSIAMNFGLPVLALRRAWRMDDGELTGPWWEMTFRYKDQRLPGTKIVTLPVYHSVGKIAHRYLTIQSFPMLRRTGRQIVRHLLKRK